MASEFVIVIPIYQGVDLLDMAAPVELFSWIGSVPETGQKVQVLVAAETLELVRTRDGLKIKPDEIFARISHVDLLWVPGGAPVSLKVQMANWAYKEFLLTSAREATYVCSVCEGALLLADAGLLDGYKATTHWAFIPCLKQYPKVDVQPDHPRFIVDDRKGPKGIRVTGGGISSGIDEALELIRRIAGTAAAEQAQVVTQYFPKPPVNGEIPPAGKCPLQTLPGAASGK